MKANESTLKFNWKLKNLFCHIQIYIKYNGIATNPLTKLNQIIVK